MRFEKIHPRKSYQDLFATVFLSQNFWHEVPTDMSLQALSFNELQEFMSPGDPVYIEWYGNGTVRIILFPTHLLAQI